jgi:hypothetical protein
LAVRIVVIEHGPGEADQLILTEYRFHGALGTLATGIIERGNPKLQCQLA